MRAVDPAARRVVLPLAFVLLFFVDNVFDQTVAREVHFRVDRAVIERAAAAGMEDCADMAELVGTAGFDWLVIDGEHGPNDIRSIRDQLMALGSSPSHPVVRVPIGETWVIKQVLDAGAQTVLVPMVESADQAVSHLVGQHDAASQAVVYISQSRKRMRQGVAGAQPVGTDGYTAYERSLQHFGPGVQIIAPGHGSA